MEEIGEKRLANLACPLGIKVSGPLLKSIFRTTLFKRYQTMINCNNDKKQPINSEIEKLGKGRLLNRCKKILSFFPFSKQAVKVNS